MRSGFLQFVMCVGLVSAAVLGASPALGADGGRQAPAPPTPSLTFDRDTAQWLVTLPLGCLDKLHEPPKSKGYIYETTVVLKADFAKTRAFYGCSDWHSAVNSTWTMIKVLKTFPDLRIARLIREKLKDHLSADAIKGEVAFFSEEGNKSFERPYGWAWLLRVYGELRSWDDPDAKKWAANLEPLAKLLLERTTPYLKTLAAPLRIGTHANTAFALRLLLEYSRANGEKPLEQAVLDRAREFYLADSGCAPNVEVSGSDFFSPCLLEAALMGEVLKGGDYPRWLTAFLPPTDSPAFKSLSVSLKMSGTNEELEKADLLGAKAHLIGLAVSRAKSLEDIAAALPPADPRVRAYRTLGRALAAEGLGAMYEAEYVGTHWIATYIVDYLVSASHGASAAGSAIR